MEKLKIEEYLARVLDCRITLEAAERPEFPFFIRKNFSFHIGEMYSRRLLFLIAKTEAWTLKELESAISIINEDVVAVFPALTRGERLGLVKRRISFIVPGTQMFLPCLGIDFFERIKARRVPENAKLRPIAQEILMEYLSDNLNPASWPLAGLAEYLKYSPMGVHRAAHQLEKINLCRIETDGYRKTVCFDRDKEALWKRALPYLQSPVRKVVAITDDTIFRNGDWLLAGEYALARHSSLIARRPCYAVYEKTYRKLLQAGEIHPAGEGDEGVADIQVWRYHLSREREGDTVDLLSLELSFRGVSDPRILHALEESKENKIW